MQASHRDLLKTTARKVLVVDDEASVRAVLARQIDRLGFKALQAGGGEDALAVVAAELPDAVLVDLRMPGVDGLTFLRRLAALGAKRLPVVVMSGAASPEEMIEVLRLGASGFMRKPWTREDLVAVLERALPSQPRHDEAAARPAPGSGGFAALLQDFDIETLEADPSVIIGLWPDLTIGYLNPAYAKFAAENGAPGLLQSYGIGSSLVAALPEPVKDYYVGHLRHALQSGQRWEHDYCCDSPLLERSFRMMAMPLGDKQGILLVHSLRRENARASAGLPLDDAGYRHPDKGGVYVQCCQCRRLRRSGNRLQWDFVPAALGPEVQAQVSHALCHACKAFYYSS